MRPNPLVREVLEGLSVADRTHSIHLAHLAVQALVLFLWWPPRNDLYHVLATANPPDTLLAVIIALGVTHAWYSMRAGAEEILLPGQHPLGEWALASPLPLSRVLGGYLGGHLLQSLHAIFLSSPFVLAAFSVGGGTWPVLLFGLAGLVMQALSYRLVGALLYLTLGHRRTLSMISVRAVLLLGYALPLAVFPAASHIMVCFHLFDASTSPAPAAIPEAATFLLLHAALILLLLVALHLVLSRHRRGAAAIAGESAP